MRTKNTITNYIIRLHYVDDDDDANLRLNWFAFLLLLNGLCCLWNESDNHNFVHRPEYIQWFRKVYPLTSNKIS